MPIPTLTIGRIGIGATEVVEGWPISTQNRITEDGEQRITEDGEIRIAE